MAFLGVFLVAGAMSVVLIALLASFFTGVLLLIAALVLGLLYRNRLRRGETPEKWQRIAAIACAVLGAVAAVPPVVIWAVLRAASA